MDIRKQFKRVYVGAHNGQRFDLQFILRYVLEETKFTPPNIPGGTKFMLVEIDNVNFVDLLNYLPIAMSALPKALDLTPEKNKGYFPHFFNTLANQNYIGQMLPKSYYCPETMFEKAQDDF